MENTLIKKDGGYGYSMRIDCLGKGNVIFVLKNENNNTSNSVYISKEQAIELSDKLIKYLSEC